MLPDILLSNYSKVDSLPQDITIIMDITTNLMDITTQDPILTVLLILIITFPCLRFLPISLSLSLRCLRV
jgi:hypothetical protein